MGKDKEIDLMENPIGYESIGKLIIKFAVPSIIANLVGALYNIVDQIFIGRGVGIVGNAATNIQFPLVFMCMALALLIGVGTSSNYNLKLGQKNKKEAAKIFGTGVSLLFLVGVILTFLVFFNLEKLLELFGSDTNTFSYAYSYSRITSIGFVFLILATGLPLMIRSDGAPKFAMTVSLVGALINTILDPIFIFVFKMGIEGAAWATVIGQGFSALISVLYVFKGLNFVNLGKRDFLIDYRSFLLITKLGSSPFINNIAMMFMQVFLNKELSFYGALSAYGSQIPLSVVGVASKINVVYIAIILGISAGAQPIMSFNYEAEKYDRVKKAAMKNIFAVTGISLIAFLIFQIFPDKLIQVFGKGDKAYQDFAISYFRIFMAVTPLNGLQPAAAFLFTAIGKAAKGMFISITRHILIFIPAVIILPKFFGLDGILYSGPLADFTAGILALGLFINEMKKLDRLLEDKKIKENRKTKTVTN